MVINVKKQQKSYQIPWDGLVHLPFNIYVPVLQVSLMSD